MEGAACSSVTLGHEPRLHLRVFASEPPSPHSSTVAPFLYSGRGILFFFFIRMGVSLTPPLRPVYTSWQQQTDPELAGRMIFLWPGNNQEELEGVDGEERSGFPGAAEVFITLTPSFYLCWVCLAESLGLYREPQRTTETWVMQGAERRRDRTTEKQLNWPEVEEEEKQLDEQEQLIARFLNWGCTIMCPFVHPSINFINTPGNNKASNNNPSIHFIDTPGINKASIIHPSFHFYLKHFINTPGNINKAFIHHPFYQNPWD